MVGLRLDLRQTQQLVMTPQLQQAIKLLAMSNLELGAFVAGEVEKNPLLEIADEGAAEAPVPGDAPEVPAVAEVEASAGAPPATDARTEDHGLTEDTFDTGTENLHDTAPADSPPTLADRPISSGLGSTSYNDGPALEERLAGTLSLREHLREQLGQAVSDSPAEIAVARYLVEELDDNGYLATPLEEIALGLNIGMDLAESALWQVQACDPAGVGARGLGECLSIQMAERGPIDPEMRLLLDNIHLLGEGDLKRLRALCGVDAPELAEMVAEIRTLNPRPGSAFTASEAQTLVPDILVTPAAWGGWTAELNPDTMPAVLMDRTYRTTIGAHGCDKTRAFLAECESSAGWLIRSLDQRARTILKVAAEILLRQERFFAEGVHALQPMTLRTVADAIGMHESTVSRVTSNKYMATGRGIFELKFFFSNAVGTEENDVAAEAVRHRIKSLVREEVNSQVLSDDAIVSLLQDEGIDIARRTVAKYRKSLNIPSSVQRRRQRALQQGL